MGTFLSNIQIYAGDESGLEVCSRLVELIREQLSADYVEVDPSREEVDRLIHVGCVENCRWITLYDDGQDTLRAAQQLSGVLDKAAVSVVLVDSDVLLLNLYEDGEELDAYNSDPDYAAEEPITPKMRKEMLGHPERWRAFLTGDATLEQLRQAWDSQSIFADSILHATAGLFGMHLDHVIELIKSMPDEKGEFTRLAFRYKHTPAYRVPAEGPPRFEIASYSPEPVLTQGDIFDIHLSAYNRGASGKGLDIVLWGEAIEQSYIEVEKGRVFLVEQPDKMVDITFQETEGRVKGENTQLLVGGLADIQLPQGIANNAAGGADWRRSYEAQQKTAIHVSIHGKVLKAGETTLMVGLVPHANLQEGKVGITHHLKIHPPSREPLHYNKEGAGSRYLRVLEQPRRLVGLISFGADQRTCAQAVSDAIRQWHSFISPLGLEDYEIATWKRLKTKPQMLSVPKEQFPDQWKDFPKILKTCKGLGGKLPSGVIGEYEIPIDNGHGFTYDPVSLYIRLMGKDNDSPHLALWADLHAPQADPDALTDALKAIIDQAMIKGQGHQAFLARWDWAPATNHTTDSTPYELVCGIHGQCTATHDWCRRFLRGVSEHIWLGRSLLDHLPDRAALEQVADIRVVGEALAVSLKPESTLDDLEKILAPLLPSQQDWLESHRELYSNINAGVIIKQLTNFS